jgi:two-component system NtrC family response regulator
MSLPAEGFSLNQLERDIIQDALVQNDWNQSQTARYLGITRNTLIYRMQKFNLRKSDD